jgi:predicted transcriptional regulator
MAIYFYTRVYRSILQYTMEQSTIKLSKKIKNDLRKQMNHPSETYETVITRLLKNTQKDDILSDEVIRNIEEGVADIKAGRVYTSDQVKKKLGLK